MLLLGPLYHLTDPSDRLRALREARRARVQATRAQTAAMLAQQQTRRAESVRQLQPEDIANAVVYVATQPSHVNINEILLRPTDQER